MKNQLKAHTEPTIGYKRMGMKKGSHKKIRKTEKFLPLQSIPVCLQNYLSVLTQRKGRYTSFPAQSGSHSYSHDNNTHVHVGGKEL